MFEIVNGDLILNNKLTTLYSTALTQHSMWRRATDGHIDCLWWHDEEQLWVRNFKRGIQGAFQNDLIKTDYWEVYLLNHLYIRECCRETFIQTDS